MVVPSPWRIRWKSALGLPPDVPLVHFGNFDVEDEWGRSEAGLALRLRDTPDPLVGRMAELAIPLGGPDDHVVLGTPAEDEYLSYLCELGLSIPRIMSVGGSDRRSTITANVTASPRLVAELSVLARQGAYLVPHGVSPGIEMLARRAAMPLAAPPAAVCKRVNSKIYSRRLGAALGLRQPQGWGCQSLDELSAAASAAGHLLVRESPVVVKDAFGVSGKGLVVVRDRRHLERVVRMIIKRAQSQKGRRDGRAQIGVVIEEWIAKQADLHYQFMVGRDGGVWLYCVAETTVSEYGVPIGNCSPTRLTRTYYKELERDAEVIGAQLHAEGFFGIVGIDAVVAPDGLYPLIDINARNNLCTYQIPLRERFLLDHGVAAARYYPIRSKRSLPFPELRDRLEHHMFATERRAGLLVVGYVISEIDPRAAERTDGHHTGRLLGLLFADTTEQVWKLDREIRGALSSCANEAMT